MLKAKSDSHAHEPPVTALPVKPLLANAFGKQIGASLRQVQLWTDQGVIKCLPETKHLGRGRKRLYDPLELPVGALVTVLARFGFTIGILHDYADTVRNFLLERQPVSLYHQRSRGWFRAALRGNFDTWMVFIPELVRERLPGEQGTPSNERLAFSWEGEPAIAKLLRTRRAATLVSVRQVISPFVR